MVDLSYGLQLLAVGLLVDFGYCGSNGIENDTIQNGVYDLSLQNKEYIELAGFQYELHKVKTEDDYIIGVHHIVNPDQPPGGHPVLIVNGAGSRSRIWLVRGRKIDLPYILSDHGYDVWLCDQRANPYSREHAILSINDRRYWNFSFHESGVYDLPAAIDYILQKTSKPKLSFLGQSLGSTFFFVMMSEREEYNNKISSSVHLVPLGNAPKIQNLPIVLKQMLHWGNILLTTLENWYLTEPQLDPFLELTALSLKAMCDPSPLQSLCLKLIQMSAGPFYDNSLDKLHLGFYIASAFGRASMKTARHMLQLYSKGGFSKFDYGPERNMKVYGTVYPTRYNISKISSPTAIFYGKNDLLVPPYIMKKTIAQLGSYARPYLFDYNHLGFAIEKSATKFAYSKIVSFFDSVIANETSNTNLF